MAASDNSDGFNRRFDELTSNGVGIGLGSILLFFAAIYAVGALGPVAVKLAQTMSKGSVIVIPLVALGAFLVYQALNMPSFDIGYLFVPGLIAVVGTFTSPIWLPMIRKNKKPGNGSTGNGQTRR